MRNECIKSFDIIGGDDEGGRWVMMTLRLNIRTRSGISLEHLIIQGSGLWKCELRSLDFHKIMSCGLSETRILLMSNESGCMLHWKDPAINLTSA